MRGLDLRLEASEECEMPLRERKKEIAAAEKPSQTGDKAAKGEKPRRNPPSAGRPEEERASGETAEKAGEADKEAGDPS